MFVLGAKEAEALVPTAIAALRRHRDFALFHFDALVDPIGSVILGIKFLVICIER